MDEELREELNRIWTNQQASEMVLAELVANAHARPEISAMLDRMIARVDTLYPEDPAMSVNMTRALDRLFRLIDHAQKTGR